MKRLLAIAAMVASVAALSGCSTFPPVDTRVTVAADVAGDVVISDIRCPRNQAGFLTFQANVVNLSPSSNVPPLSF